MSLGVQVIAHVDVGGVLCAVRCRADSVLVISRMMKERSRLSEMFTVVVCGVVVPVVIDGACRDIRALLRVDSGKSADGYLV